MSSVSLLALGLSSQAFAAPTTSVFSLGGPRIDFDADSYISNGKAAGECALPALARLSMGGSSCTGTLVHPQVIAYAAHCGRLRSAAVGENGKGPNLSGFKKTATNPRFNINKLVSPDGEPQDWAYAVLSKPVSGIPIIPFASPGEYKVIMESKARIVMGGFGMTRPGGGPVRQMMWVENEVAETCSGWIQAGLKSKNACPGDSGGPLLAQLPDGSWRVIGIASTLYGEDPTGKTNCGKPTSFNHYARVRPEMVEWFEKNTGFDLTPCYDTKGNEDKTDACKGFYAGDPASPSGSWSSNCKDAKTVDEPKLYPADKDKKAPTVELSWPKDKSVYGPGQTIEIRVAAKDDTKLGTVSLSINDVLRKQWDKPPYIFEWETDEKAQPFNLRVTARDAAGNEADYKLYTIETKEGEEGVEKDPDAKDEEEGTESSGEETEGSGDETEGSGKESSGEETEGSGDETEGDETEGDETDGETTKGSGKDSKGEDTETSEKKDETEEPTEKTEEKSATPDATKDGGSANASGKEPTPTKGCNLDGDASPGLLLLGLLGGLGMVRRRK